MSPAAGVGFKAEHFAEALAAPAAALWFEVPPENDMCDGGPRLAMLTALRRDRPLSLHGVGMSLGGATEPDREHLAALKRLVDRFEPELVSEHLAWSRLDGRCFPDLLPRRPTTCRRREAKANDHGAASRAWRGVDRHRPCSFRDELRTRDPPPARRAPLRNVRP